MKKTLGNHQGFGLVESLITMGLLIIVLGSVYSLLAFNQTTASVQDQVLGLNRAAIGASELIGREARQAGLKLGTNHFQVTNDPAVGDLTVTLSLTAAQTAARCPVGSSIYFFDTAENAQVAAVTGNQLTIDTNPVQAGNQGLAQDHSQLAEASCGGAGTLGTVAQMIPSGFLPTSPAAVTLGSSDYPIKITQGSSGASDIITIVGAIGDQTYPTQVTNVPALGSTALTLKITADQTQARYAVGDVIYIGEVAENAKVAAVNGNQLTIDTDPGISGNQGLTKAHGQWTEVGKISVISYAVINVNGIKTLKRKENNSSFESVAEDGVVIDLQATQNGKSATINSLVVQTNKPDPKYPSNSGYRQKTISMQLATMNF